MSKIQPKDLIELGFEYGDCAGVMERDEVNKPILEFAIWSQCLYLSNGTEFKPKSLEDLRSILNSL